MMLGSSLEAAAPAKALPSAEALFSRIWKPDPQASPKNTSAVVATAISIASHLTQSSTASPRNVSPQNGKRKRRTQTVINLVLAAPRRMASRSLRPPRFVRAQAPVFAPPLVAGRRNALIDQK